MSFDKDWVMRMKLERHLKFNCIERSISVLCVSHQNKTETASLSRYFHAENEAFHFHWKFWASYRDLKMPLFRLFIDISAHYLSTRMKKNRLYNLSLECWKDDLEWNILIDLRRRNSSRKYSVNFFNRWEEIMIRNDILIMNLANHFGRGGVGFSY